MDEFVTVQGCNRASGRLPFPFGTGVVSLVNVFAQNGRILHPGGAVGEWLVRP